MNKQTYNIERVDTEKKTIDLKLSVKDYLLIYEAVLNYDKQLQEDKITSKVDNAADRMYHILAELYYIPIDSLISRRSIGVDTMLNILSNGDKSEGLVIDMMMRKPTKEEADGLFAETK